MKVGVFLCTCGTNISSKLDPAKVRPRLVGLPGVAFVEEVAFACGADGQAAMHATLTRERPDGVVVAACSIREHEETFRGVLERAGLNPFLLQLVNVREHIAWVTKDADRAVEKAVTQLRAAIARTALQQPLERRTLPVCTDALIIGAGPAGLNAALRLAEAGRRVTLVEKSSLLGGAPISFDEVAPSLECGSCLVEPLLARALHGEVASRITVRTLAEVVGLKGSYGHFTATVRQRARFVDTTTCLGCMACIEPCPASLPSAFELGLATRKAIDFEHFGGLPSVPVLEAPACVHARGEACTACVDACPVPGCIDFSARDQDLEVDVGAVVVAIGAGQPGAAALAAFGLGTVPGVMTAWELERRLSTSGPTQGEVRAPSGEAPRSVVLIHGAGARDEASLAVAAPGLGTQAAKYHHLLRKQHPGVTVHHVYVHEAFADAASFRLHAEVRAHGDGEWRRVATLGEVRINEGPSTPLGVNGEPGSSQDSGSRAHTDSDTDARAEPNSATPAEVPRRSPRAESRGPTLLVTTATGAPLAADLVVLITPPLPSPSLPALARVLGLPLGDDGVPLPAHPVLDRQRSPVRGLILAGAAAGGTDLASAFTSGAAAAGAVLSELVPGRELPLEPAVAEVDAARCSGCRSCLGACPYHALSRDPTRPVARVNPALCVGCGACVATCPSTALTQHHFTNAQVMAEIAEALR